MNYPLIIGHRGASAVTPENTMAAFRKAIEVGADGIEFDVRLSRDGVPVIIHDDTLRRTASRTQRVSDLSAQELRTVNVGSWFSNARRSPIDEYPDECIPTLQELLDDFADNDALLYLELKCDASQLSEIVSVTCRMLENHSARERVIVECFDLNAIEAVKRLAPDITTAALFEANLRNSGAFLSGRALVERANAVNANEIALHHTLATKRTVETARASGLKVAVWTVDDPGWLKRSREYGIDSLITNDPKLLVHHRREAW